MIVLTMTVYWILVENHDCGMEIMETTRENLTNIRQDVVDKRIDI